MVTEGATGTYTVALATEPSADVTVTVSGQAGTDVSLSGLTNNGLTFTTGNWDTSQTVTVAAAHDLDAVDDEVTLTHTIASADADYEGLSLGVPVTVDDDDTPVVLVSNSGQSGNQRATYNRDHGQAFTTGNSSNGYIFSSVTIISEDPEADPIALQICGVDEGGAPTEPCTGLTPPDSFARGPLVFTVPDGSTLTLAPGTTHMVVFDAPNAGEVRVAATSSDGEDSTSLPGWSIRNKFQWNSPTGWQDSSRDNAIRIVISGTVISGTVIADDEAGVVTIVGTPQAGVDLAATLADPDGGVSLVSWSWSRAGTRDGVFSVISGATGESYTPGAADVGMFLKAAASYSDAFGPGRTASGTAESAVARSVPVFSAADYPDGAAARSVAENAASGAVVGVAVTATDVDGDTLTYSVAETTESDAAADLAAFSRDFSIDSASGQISVNAAAMINFEDRSVYKVLYRVSNGVDAAGDPDNAIDDTVTLTVTVTNVDEAGVVTIVGTPQAGVDLAATLADPDGGVSLVSWSWSRAGTRDGVFSVISGATGESYTPGAADVGMFLRAAASYSDAFGPGRTASGTAESAVAHSVPVSSAADYPDGAAARSVAENAASGAVVGVAVTATDVDGDTLTYSVAETTETDAAADLAAFSRDFSIDSASGQISINAAAMIDFEDRSVYKVLYRVSNGVDAAGDPDNAIDDMVTLTVTVTNVDDVYDAVTAAGVSVEVDDDDDAAVSVSFGSGMYSVSEDGMTASVTVSLSAVPDREVVIPIAVTNQGDTSAGDYTAAPATLTFAAVDDRVDDDGESVVLGFGTLPSGVSAGSPSTATVTIVDNDTAGVDEWAAEISTRGGAGAVIYDFRETPGDPGTYEMYGTVDFRGNGSLSLNVRGRFGQRWGTWSLTGSLHCYEVQRPG